MTYLFSHTLLELCKLVTIYKDKVCASNKNLSHWFIFIVCVSKISERVQAVDHVEDVQPHEYPNHVWMNVCKRDLRVVHELSYQIWKWKLETNNKLFIGEIHGII